MNSLFPEDSAARKEYPVYSGFLRYFPAAVAAISRHSFLGNLKHNPGKPLHHDRSKSDDELDALCRHLLEHEIPGMEGELVAAAWRAMSALQKHLEANGAPIAPGARIPAYEDQSGTPIASYEEQAVQHHAAEAPSVRWEQQAAGSFEVVIDPALLAKLSRAESDDPQVGSLKAGEAETST